MPLALSAVTVTAEDAPNMLRPTLVEGAFILMTLGAALLAVLALVRVAQTDEVGSFAKLLWLLAIVMVPVLGSLAALWLLHPSQQVLDQRERRRQRRSQRRAARKL